MANSRSTFVSPGVFTSEKDLTFVQQQIGVTTLGLVGETPRGPAFEPFFVENYERFTSLFGGLNPETFRETGYPKYELNYIAKQYLQQSNQLYITRVLGLTGYNARRMWLLKTNGGIDPETVELASEDLIEDLSVTIEYNFETDTYTILDGDGPIMPGSLEIWENYFRRGRPIKSLQPGDSKPSGSIIWDINLVNNGVPDTRQNASGDTINDATDGYDIVNLLVDTVEDRTDIDDTIIFSATYDFFAYVAAVSDKFRDGIVLTLRERGIYDSKERFISFVGANPAVQIVGATSLSTDINADFDIAIVLGPGHPEFLPDAGDVANTKTYSVSLDPLKRNYIAKVFGEGCFDKQAPVYVEELYGNTLKGKFIKGEILSINESLVTIDRSFNPDVRVNGVSITNNSGLPTDETVFSNYNEQYQSAKTPYVVSELRGDKLFRLFRFWTISDGESANSEIKITIENIRLDERIFDVVVRRYTDVDASRITLERFARCTMDITKPNFILTKIGSIDGEYPQKSSFISVELSKACAYDAFPAGFEGYTYRDYGDSSGAEDRSNCKDLVCYKTRYENTEKFRKATLGLTDLAGYDTALFKYKGRPNFTLYNKSFWLNVTPGFHMDKDANMATVEGTETVFNVDGDTYVPNITFEVGDFTFRSEFDVENTPYETLNARSFTLMPAGGFDGWDIYRQERTNSNPYRHKGFKSRIGLLTGSIRFRSTSRGEIGNNSDYYAYLEGIYTFSNPEAININVFATPGIDLFNNSDLVDEAIDMIENERCDSLYIITMPDKDTDGVFLTPEDVSSDLDDLFDSNYSATYYPWIQMPDNENNKFVWLPATAEVVRNIALTDNVAFPWFASAGVNRGATKAEKARTILRQEDRDTLYNNRINPIATFATEGVIIWGNKTLQVRESALDRINVRRLLLQARKLISAVAIRLLFDQNDDVVRGQFLAQVNPILDSIRKERGLTDFRVALVDTVESIDRGELNGRIFIKPTRSLEFISLEFAVTPTGASFENI